MLVVAIFSSARFPILLTCFTAEDISPKVDLSSPNLLPESFINLEKEEIGEITLFLSLAVASTFSTLSFVEIFKKESLIKINTIESIMTDATIDIVRADLCFVFSSLERIRII
jgi:hypothetical protein